MRIKQYERPSGLAFRRFRYAAAALTFTVGVVVLSAAFAGAASDRDPHKTHLKVGCSTSLFRGIDSGELISTAKLWVRTLGKGEGVTIPEPEIVLADNVRELRAEVDTGAVDLVITSSLEYLEMDRARVVTPEITLTPALNESGKLTYLVLVNRDSSIQNVNDLSGKTINTYSRSASGLNRLWLDVLLANAHLGSADSLFRSVSLTTKPSTACLPVFFGKADACLIDSASWDTLRELNPQVGFKMKSLAESQPLVEALISMRATRQEFRSEILHSIRTLQDDAEGRQVLLLFKCSRAVKIIASDLNEVAALRATYFKVTRPSERRLLLPGAGSPLEPSEVK